MLVPGGRVPAARVAERVRAAYLADRVVGHLHELLDDQLGSGHVVYRLTVHHYPGAELQLLLARRRPTASSTACCRICLGHRRCSCVTYQTTQYREKCASSRTVRDSKCNHMSIRHRLEAANSCAPVFAVALQIEHAVLYRLSSNVLICDASWSLCGLSAFSPAVRLDATRRCRQAGHRQGGQAQCGRARWWKWARCRWAAWRSRVSRCDQASGGKASCGGAG